MIEMSPPKSWPRGKDGTYGAIKLHSGGTTFPLKGADGSTIYRVVDEPDAADLEARGFRRDRISQHMKSLETDLLRKGLAAQARHMGVAKTFAAPGSATSGLQPYDLEGARDGKNIRRDPHARATSLMSDGPRVEFGDVEVGAGRVVVSHDQGADEAIVIHGHRVPLKNIDKDLRQAFRAASASYLNHMEDQELQVACRVLVGGVVDAIMRRHDDFVGAEVKRRLQNQRYD